MDRMPPDSFHDWIEVARERQNDAKAIIKQYSDDNPNQPLGAVYIAGYSIECSLKAYLRQERKRIPTQGRKGHDLQLLLKECGLRPSDFKGQPDAILFFIHNWSTDLRYETEIVLNASPHKLVVGAGKISGFLQRRIRRRNRQRRR
jgi:hypothetical protein